MSLLERTKGYLRVSNQEFDAEVQMLIDAAKADMRRVGVREELLESDAPLVEMAVASYAKAQFGFDNPDAEFYRQSYRQTVADLLNSSANVAAGESE